MKNALSFLMIGLVTLILTMSWLSKRVPEESRLTSTQLHSILSNVIKFSVLEIHLSSLYEVSKDHLRIADIPIPLTSQKSLLIVKGVAQIGVDLNDEHIRLEKVSEQIKIELTPPKVLTLDVNIRTLYENDYFINRISVEDRNQTMDRVRAHIRQTLLTTQVRQDAEQRIRQLLDQWFEILELTYTLEFVTP